MVLRRKFIALLLILLGIYSLFPNYGSAQTVREFAGFDSLKVGDTFDFSITLNHSQQYQKISFPDSSSFGDVFEIRSRRHFQISSSKDSVAYRLQFFGTSDTTLSALPVNLITEEDTTTLYTNPLVVHFKSVLAKDEQELRPLKPIFEFAAAWWPYILGLIVLIIAAYFAYRHFTGEQKKEEPQERKSFTPTPFVNPLKELQKSIRELEQMNLDSREDFKEFYITLGDAIREYYEELHDIPALESTSREILMMLGDRAIDQDLISDTRAVLQEADMVKFANFTPTEKMAERALEKAHNFQERAKKVDGPRIEHLRRTHHSEMEKERERFNEQKDQGEE